MAKPHTVYLLGSSHLESAVNKAAGSPQSSGSVSSCLLVEAQDGGLNDTVTDRQALEKPEWLPGTAQVPSYQQSREAEVCPRPWLCQPFPSLSSNCSVGKTPHGHGAAPHGDHASGVCLLCAHWQLLHTLWRDVYSNLLDILKKGLFYY